MKVKNAIMFSITGMCIVLSIAATYYKTVVLQDFIITGVSIEFLEGDSSAVFFVYENTQYQIEVPTTDYNLLLLAVADEIGTPVAELDQEFLNYFEAAYSELNA